LENQKNPKNLSIYEAIGRGRHSVVYKGRRKKTIDYYAIKSVDKGLKPRVLQEVRVSPPPPLAPPCTSCLRSPLCLPSALPLP